MHHALQIEEILLNTFGHCRLPSRKSATSDLPALARTCHAFKEPALDILWKKLIDPSPLAQCLPEASHWADERYSFSRSLTQVEWCILRSYTRRIRFMDNYHCGLNWESVRTFLNPPTTEPLFPNLRYLCAARPAEIDTLLCMPFPSLISLDIVLGGERNLNVLQSSLELFSKFSPNTRRLSIYLNRPLGITLSNFFSGYICRWRDLQTVDFCHIVLGVDALVHLSHMSSLTLLHCMPSTILPPADSPLSFSNLQHLRLSSKSLDPISQLLSRIRLPAITVFAAYIDNCSSKLCFSSFLTSVQTSVIGHTIQELVFEEECGLQDGEDGTYVLGFEDLQPCMAFCDLRYIDLNLSWNVDLTDNELLILASAWPHLEHLHINVHYGWNTTGGITPNGLLQLLQTCRSLSKIGLAIDTRGYTEFRESPASLGLTLPSTFSIDVTDSFIERECVPAIAAFFTCIASCSKFSLHAFSGLSTKRVDCRARWLDAYKRVNDALRLSQRS